MNILIEKWNSVRKTSDSHGDSLLMLVDYFIENNLCDMSEMTKAISKEHHDKRQRASVKLVEPESNVAKIIDIAESSNRESRELKGVQGQKSKVINDDESKERLSLKEFENVMKGQLETFEKRLDELKKEMKEMIEQATKYNGKIINKKEEKKINLENWNKMRSALHKYDVSMDGIHAFQRFRFNCSAGHLW
ncbi:uncharacterized protein LOC131054524 [Cryptomeria japonica]|uniref:uncharacterized protein LOC131054524 n=1 Tax=Cryptomeria japonica TaxID=3369 RepID=UPI0025AC11C5|nr:uncharacterized protein LOC131054524 [Cryptomeria japonica]